MNKQLKHLFSPLKVGSLTLSNRIIYPPMSMSYTQNGVPTERLAAHIAGIAGGGVGMIVTESQVVHPSSVYKPMNIHAFDDRSIAGLKMLADSAHRFGVPIVGHLAHMGLQATYRSTLTTLLAPSVMSRRGVRSIPKAMEHEDIKEIVACFASAAVRNKQAGLDGVEIHGAHGHLIGQFMSPITNLRMDEYGGSLENRLRFPMEIIHAVRDAVGRKYVVGMKISGDELLEGGLTHGDMKTIAARLAATGLIDYLAISIGTYATLPPSMASWYLPPGPIVEVAAGIKQSVNIPVFVGSRIKGLEHAEETLANGKADGVMLGRPLLADPQLPKKALEGRVDDIRPCIYCNFCFATGGLTQASPVLCAVNADIGYEREAAQVKPAKPAKSVTVIGGGPAGLQAALAAALRGHKVSLYEKSPALGGQVALFGKDQNTAELAGIIDYLARQLAKHGVKVTLNTEVTTKLLKETTPDVVIVATGARPYLPDMPGIKGKNVMGYEDALLHPEKVGKKVVVLAGEYGFLTPLSVADFLLDKGHHVELVSELAVAGADIDSLVRATLNGRLSIKGLVLRQLASVKAIEGNAVVIVDSFSKAQSKIEGVDTVVVAAGTRSDDGLYKALGGRAAGVYAIGDCVSPRGLFAATSEGAKIGRAI